MGDSAYSFSLTTFSPSGKLVQIEYAFQAVASGNTSIGIKSEPPPHPPFGAPARRAPNPASSAEVCWQRSGALGSPPRSAPLGCQAGF